MREITYTLTLDDGATVEVPEAYLSPCSMDDVGYCTTCGGERFQTEPDARGYPCESCDTPTVSGAVELLIEGRIA
tara:strand:- start:153 stop:377 length:225 start_codon:yes stop_codon:yes gene_type:complete